MLVHQRVSTVHVCWDIWVGRSWSIMAGVPLLWGGAAHQCSARGWKAILMRNQTHQMTSCDPMNAVAITYPVTCTLPGERWFSFCFVLPLNRPLSHICLRPKIALGNCSPSRSVLFRLWSIRIVEWYMLWPAMVRGWSIPDLRMAITGIYRYKDIPCGMDHHTPYVSIWQYGPSDPSSVQGICQETRDSLGDAAENLADLWATRADILMNLGGLKRASNVPCQEALSISPFIYIYIWIIYIYVYIYIYIHI